MEDNLEFLKTEPGPGLLHYLWYHNTLTDSQRKAYDKEIARRERMAWEGANEALEHFYEVDAFKHLREIS